MRKYNISFCGFVQFCPALSSFVQSQNHSVARLTLIRGIISVAKLLNLYFRGLCFSMRNDGSNYCCGGSSTSGKRGTGVDFDISSSSLDHIRLDISRQRGNGRSGLPGLPNPRFPRLMALLQRDCSLLLNIHSMTDRTPCACRRTPFP